MTNSEIVEEEVMKETKHPHLRVMRGGNGPPLAPVTNWLKELKKNSVFSCKDKQNNGMVLILILAFIHPKTYVLRDALGNNPPMAVDEDFCKRFTLLEVIEEGGEHPEGDRDDGIRTVRPASLAHDADAEGGQSTDGEA